MCETMLIATRNLLAAVVLLVCLTGSGLAAYGLFWVTSNIVHVDMQYTVELSASGSRNVVTLTARVRLNGELVGEGINVDFYYSLNGGDWIHFATEATNRNGAARTSYRVTSNGAYDFRAMVSVP